MADVIRYIGLDFETSGTDPWGDAVPIQIGMAVDDETSKWHTSHLIGGWNWSNWEWSEEAFQVHGITQDRIAKSRPVWQVDIILAAELLHAGYQNRMWNVIVGWNVAGFDRQFITRWFPNLNRLLSYRTLDLNALVFDRAGPKEERYKSIKKDAKVYAQQRLYDQDVPDLWHDAEYDARAALYSLEYLREHA